MNVQLQLLVRMQTDFTRDASPELVLSVINRPKMTLLVFTYLYLGYLLALSKFFGDAVITRD